MPAASVRRWRKCWRGEGKSNQLSTVLLEVTIIDSIPAFAWRLQMPILDKLRLWLELCLVLHWRSLLMPQLGIPKSAHSKRSWANSRGLTMYMPVCCIALHRFCAGRLTDMRASRWCWRKGLDTQRSYKHRLRRTQPESTRCGSEWSAVYLRACNTADETSGAGRDRLPRQE